MVRPATSRPATSRPATIRLAVVRRVVAAALVASLGAGCGGPDDAGPNAAPSAAAGFGAADVTASPAPLEVSDRVLLGAYLDLKGQTLAESLRLRRQQLGRDPRILHYFYAWEDSLPTRFEELPEGSIPLVSWRAPAYHLINDGGQDERIARAARALRRYGKPVFLRWAWEMNGNWYPWGGAKNNRDTAGFVDAWRRLHGIFTAQQASNVVWVWGPNYNSKPTEPWNAIERYYPGDAYVDWVATSGYNFNRESPGTLFDAVYDAYAPRKPIMLAETGAVDRGGSSKPDWIDALHAWVDARPRIGAVVWFDTDDHPGSTEDWRIDSTAESLAAYRDMSGDPRFTA